MSKFLDKTGLAALWTKIKDTFAEKSDLDNYVDLTSDQEIGGTKTFTGDYAEFNVVLVSNEGGLYIGDNDEVTLDMSQFSMSNDGFHTYFNAGAIWTDGPYGSIRISVNDELDGIPFIKLTSADDPDNYYTYVSTSSLTFAAGGNTFDIYPEDGYFGLFCGDYVTNINAGNITLTGDVGELYLSAQDDGEVSVPHLTLSYKDGNGGTNYTEYSTDSIYRKYGDRGYTYSFPNKDGTIALLSDLEGGSVDFYENGYLYAYGMYNKNESGCAIGFNDAGEPCILNVYNRGINIATDSLDGDYIYYAFPEYGGEVAVKDENGCLAVPELGASNYFWLGDNDELMFDPVNGDYSIANGTFTFSNTEIVITKNYGMQCIGTNNGFFNANGYPGIATDDGSIYINASGQMDYGQGYWIKFPDAAGTLATLEDLAADKIYQHDIYIMPGGSNAAGIYIYFTLNIRQSSKLSSVANICSTLYNRGNNVQQQAVSATGRCGTSSSSFSGFIIGVWASNASTLNIVYLTSSGALNTTSYSASMFTNFRDTVN